MLLKYFKGLAWMFNLPRERGLTSLWLATLVYSLVQIRDYDVLVVLGILGSLFILTISDSTLERIMKGDFRGVLFRGFLVSVFYIPIVYWRFWSSLFLIIIAATLFLLLVYTVRAAGLSHYSIIVGSCLISLHSIFLLVADGFLGLEFTFYPLFYVLTSTSQASIRVLGFRREVASVFYFSMVAGMVYCYLVFFAYGFETPFYIVFLGYTLRMFHEVTGVSERISIRVYGVLELIRSLLVLGLVGFSVRTGSKYWF